MTDDIETPGAPEEPHSADSTQGPLSKAEDIGNAVGAAAELGGCLAEGCSCAAVVSIALIVSAGSAVAAMLWK